MDDITVERDESAEDYAGIRVEGCNGGFAEDGEFFVIGEAATTSGNPLKGRVEIHATAYDASGRIVGRGLTGIHGFGLRQSFDIPIDLVGKNPAPVRIRVFPTKNA